MPTAKSIGLGGSWWDPSAGTQRRKLGVSAAGAASSGGAVCVRAACVCPRQRGSSAPHPLPSSS